MEYQRSIDAPAGVVWDVMTDPDVYAEVAPNLSAVEIVEGDGEGMCRRCVDTDGNAWTETCHRWDEGSGFGVTVDVANSDFHRRLFDRFEGYWELTDGTEDVLVTIRFDFDPKFGPLGVFISKFLGFKAPSIVESIFDGWEAEIDRRLSDSASETTRPETPDRNRRQPNALFR